MRRLFFSDAGRGNRSISSARNGRPGPKGRRAQRFSVESLESRCLLSTGNIVAVFQYPLTSPARSPAEIIQAGGKLWFTDQSSTNVWEIANPASPSTPTSVTGGGSSSPGITADPNDPNHYVWVTEPGAHEIGRFNASDSTPTITNFASSPLPANAAPQGIAVGLDQSGHSVIWFTNSTNNAIESFDPSTDTFSTPIPVVGTDQNGNPLFGFSGYASKIVAGTDADRTLWFIEKNSSTGEFAIGGYDPRTGHWSQVTLPKGTNGSWETPYGITVTPDGNIWLGEAVSKLPPQTGLFFASIWKIIPGVTPTASEFQITNAVTGTPVTPPPLPYGLAVGPDNNIWFADNDTGAIYMFNLATEKFATEAVTTSSTPILQGITAGPDGNIWFTDNNGAVDRKYLATQLVVAATSVTAGSGIAVNAEDSFGNIDPTYSGTVTLTVTSNSGGSPITLPPATASQGVATFSASALNIAGGYTVQATATGLTATPSSSVNVVPAAATGFVIAQQPPASVNAGSGFSVLVSFEDSFGNAATYSGNVNLALATSPTTILATVPVNGGSSAQFSGLTLSKGGNYSLLFSASDLTSSTSNSFNVIAPPAPHIQGATVVTTQKTNKKGKPIGKPVLSGYQFTFDTAMSSGTGNSANYKPGTYVQVTMKVGKKKVKVLKLQPIGFRLNYVSSNRVQLILNGKQAFKLGGQITLVAAGISSAAGGFLGGNAVYNIAKGGFGISHA
jgi:streptogramin lyase